MTQTQGSIGYVEFAYALQNKMTTTRMMNKEGRGRRGRERLVSGGSGQR